MNHQHPSLDGFLRRARRPETNWMDRTTKLVGASDMSVELVEMALAFASGGKFVDIVIHPNLPLGTLLGFDAAGWTTIWVRPEAGPN